MKKIAFNGQKNVIGGRLRAIREAGHITQIDLVARMQVQNVNLDQKAISSVENNQRIVTDYELACFARALGVSPQALLQDFYTQFPE